MQSLDINPQLMEALLGLICVLIVWLVYGVHSLKVEFRGMEEALRIRVKDADRAHDRYDNYGDDLEAIRERVARLEEKTNRRHA